MMLIGLTTAQEGKLIWLNPANIVQMIETSDTQSTLIKLNLGEEKNVLAVKEDANTILKLIKEEK